MSTTTFLASCIPSVAYKPLRRLLCSALRHGPVPAHLAVIMDGNRRWTAHRNLALTKGHTEGFEALRGLLGFLLELQVQQVTVYAFAIDNFKRSQEEVDTLMELARSKLLELARHG